MASASEITIRRMSSVDLDLILAIEAESHPSAWPRGAFERLLGGRGVIACVLEVGGELRAFLVVKVDGDQLHVQNLAVAARVRRQGLGRALMAEIETVARERELRRIVLEVREGNLPGQLLYRECGFRVVEILRAFYGGEDGYRMTREVRPLLGPGPGAESPRPE